MNSVIFLILRRMRAPLIVLIVFYTVGVLVLTIVPGQNADGTPGPPLSFFHAFYFISYTATTIGFGEIPWAFSDAQRLWVTVCIYMTVIAWTYAIVKVLALLQDKAFLQALTDSRFARRVRHMHMPFYLICGCGETGSLICRALDVLGYDFAILEKNVLRVEELAMEDFITNDPVLAADASASSYLLMAGLCHPQCRGVLAVTNDEQANLAIAINVRLLAPGMPVLARVRNPLVAANMASFGTHHIVNAYERFAEYLALAISSPERFRLIEILTGLPDTPLPEVHRPPLGRWIVCGYGLFGSAVCRYLDLPGIDISVIDPKYEGPANAGILRGIGTEASVLKEAGIAEALGIVAGSDNDISNLSIAVMAKKLNPNIFVVTRQNQAANDMLFDAFKADFSMVHTRVVAQECISIITTPLLARFLSAVRMADESWSKQVCARLEEICEGRVPEVWDVEIETLLAPAVHKTLMSEQPICVGQLMRNNGEWERALPAVVLMIVRRGKSFLLPGDDFALEAEDALLVAGQHDARSSLHLTLQNANALEYVLTGEDRRGGRLWQLLFGKQQPPG
ncbi:potassium channel family protein [Massilia niastensis]|uniref:potassium channel family protein n=1 Tax=Massilia niastensis TaxID=544911 RepID=UPI00036C977D|nr:NAD-binding protein [Massilia niastensis]